MSCVRFETEGLLALERGDVLDPHFDECPECAAAKGRYERLREGLAAVDEGIEAPADFEARVWARIALQAPERASLWSGAWAWLARTMPARRPVWAGLAAAFAGGIAALFLWLPGPKGPVEPSLAVDVVEGAVKVRGTGDVLRLLATIDPDVYAELRVYRAGRLALRCSSEPPCQRSGSRLEAEERIEAPGRHELVLLLARAPLPAPEGRFDSDMDAAEKAGAQILTAEPIEAY